MLISTAARRGWIMSGGRRLATLAVAIAAFTVALAFDANGFIAAFVAGIAFGALLDRKVVDLEEAAELPELGGELLALVVWFLFGATLVPLALEDLDWRTVVYALASLTVIRMLPVALSLVRSGLDRPSVVFIGWFGPRGLASVVFALLAIEELGETSPEVRRAVATVALTVLLSVLLHGITARRGGRRYVQIEQHKPGSEPAPRSRPSTLAARDQLTLRPREAAVAVIVNRRALARSVVPRSARRRRREARRVVPHPCRRTPRR